MCASVISSLAIIENVILELPTLSILEVILTIVPIRAVETKLILSMNLVTQTYPVVFRACIPALSSAHFIKKPPCKVPCAFKTGCVTRYLKSISLTGSLFFKTSYRIDLVFFLYISQAFLYRRFQNGIGKTHLLVNIYFYNFSKSCFLPTYGLVAGQSKPDRES